jgi:hypothetical protein
LKGIVIIAVTMEEEEGIITDINSLRM